MNEWIRHHQHHWWFSLDWKLTHLTGSRRWNMETARVYQLISRPKIIRLVNLSVIPLSNRSVFSILSNQAQNNPTLKLKSSFITTRRVKKKMSQGWISCQVQMSSSYWRKSYLRFLLDCPTAQEKQQPRRRFPYRSLIIKSRLQLKMAIAFRYKISNLNDTPSWCAAPTFCITCSSQKWRGREPIQLKSKPHDKCDGVPKWY